METLPVEIIQGIICCENLSVSDLVNFSLTNQYNNLVVTNSNNIWKKMYCKTWPQFVELFDDKFHYCWYSEVQYMYDLKRRTREILSTIASRIFKISRGISDFTEWLELYQEKPQSYYYLIDDLMNIVNTNVPIQSIEVVPLTTPGNKTLQYYAMEVLKYLRQLHLVEEWETFITLPHKLQTLEKGIAFFGQWFQPNSVSWMNIAAEFDELTEKVKENLKVAYPNHPVFAVPKEQLEMWRNENIECDKYSFSYCMQIKHAMANVIRYQFGKSYPSNNIFLTIRLLEKVIDCAAQAISLVIYEAVGRRLGVKYEPIVGITGLYLRSSGSNIPEEYQYIDYYYGFYGFDPMLSIENSYAVATTQQVVKFIAKQVVDAHSRPLISRIAMERLYSCLEFLILVSPSDDRKQLCMYYNMDPTSCIRVELLISQKKQAPYQIERIINKLRQYETGRHYGVQQFREIEPKVRPTNLKYAVGMVMEHSSENDLCVICDWFCSSSDEEPIYSVLFPDGSDLYVAQCNLMILSRIRSSSELLTWCFKDIGLHFSHRFETVFVPNAEKEREYPADTAVRNIYNDQIKPLT